MTTTAKAGILLGLLIPADDDRLIEALAIARDDELAQIQAAVGGYVEAVFIRPGDLRCVMLMNEEGLLQRLRPNVRATRLAQRAIVGDVLLVGVPDRDAEFTHFPAEWVAEALDISQGS